MEGHGEPARILRVEDQFRTQVQNASSYELAVASLATSPAMSARQFPQADAETLNLQQPSPL